MRVCVCPGGCAALGSALGPGRVEKSGLWSPQNRSGANFHTTKNNFSLSSPPFSGCCNSLSDGGVVKGGTLLQCDAGGGAETSLEAANPKISHPNSWSGHGFMSWNSQAGQR